MLRDILEIKREEVTGDWRKYMLRSFMFCAAHQAFRGLSERVCNWRGMWHVLGRREILVGLFVVWSVAVICLVSLFAGFSLLLIAVYNVGVQSLRTELCSLHSTTCCSGLFWVYFFTRCNESGRLLGSGARLQMVPTYSDLETTKQNRSTQYSQDFSVC